MLLIAILPGSAHAQEPPPAAAPLTVSNRQVFVFRTPMFGLTAQQRATRAAERIGELPFARLRSPPQANGFAHEGMQGYAIMVEGETLFTVFEGDREPGDPPLEQVANSAGQRLHEALMARADQMDGRQFAASVAWTALATLILAAFVFALHRVAVRTEGRTGELRARVEGRKLLDWRRMIVLGLLGAIHWIKIAIVLMAVYVWLAYVLTRFPYTQPWGQTLGSSVLALATKLSTGILHSLPDLATVAVIFVLAHLAIRGLHAIFEAARSSGVTLAALQEDTIGATRRLTAALVWVFALVMAYPFIPGSHSDAFKGLSVFFGVLVTLGSSGTVSQVMAGFVLIYARALRIGDFVQIGESEGYVVEMGVLSTKLRNRVDQVVTLPNTVVVAASILNLSDTSKGPKGLGISLATEVTIGYDAPWRQVHAMLVLAAGRTAELLPQPPPVVRQLHLQDFYVEYELNVFMRAGAPKYDVLNELHGHIQDVFNEYGVQIMSPHFVLQPAQSVVIPKDGWHAPPAA
jgi:small-conductance mechanosensitive channel